MPKIIINKETPVKGIVDFVLDVIAYNVPTQKIEDAINRSEFKDKIKFEE